MNNGKIKRISYRALPMFFIICIAISIAKTVDAADSKEWISYGETVFGYLSGENPSDNYYFNGYKGDTIHITMEKIEGDLEPFLALSYIDTKDNSENWVIDTHSFQKEAVYSVLISDFTLDKTGTYIIKASRNESGTMSGDYVLQLICSGCNSESESADTSSSSQNKGNGCTYYAEWPTTSDPDSDCDGFSDDLETLLFDSFSPVLVLDEEEDDCIDDPVNSFDVLYQISPYETDERYSHKGALITVVVLWNQDCGGFSSSITGHPGDAETMRVWVTQSPFDSKWSVTGVLWRVHGDNWNYEPVDDLYNSIGEVNFGWHYLMYVAESKHAMYPSKGKCESRHYGLAEDCDDGEIILLSNMNVSPGGNVYSRVVPSSHNVGEVNNRNFDQLGETGDYYLNFPNTYAWSEKFSDGREMVFCGHEEEIRIGPEAWGDCPGGIFSKWWPEIDSERYTDIVNFLKTHD